jgi:hypothetical protein
MKWFINRQLEREIPFGPNSKKDFINDNSFREQKNIWRQLPEEDRLDPEHTIIPKIPYIEAKMELRNYIAEESGDKDYAYGKEDVASYTHGQIDMLSSKTINPLGLESLNVAVCDDGEIIRRDQLDNIDPFDFVPLFHSDSYLISPKKKKWQIEKGFNVGLIWDGSGIDIRRTIPFKEFEAWLADIPNINFYGLQKGTGLKEYRISDRLFVNFGDKIKDWGDTADILNQLNLLITVDTGVAHLGGAMGIPTWILVHTNADWRWFRDRDDSPWYDSVTIFRQIKAFDWGPVLWKVRKKLECIGQKYEKIS